MSQYEDSVSEALGAGAGDMSGLAVGFILMGTVMMMLLGCFQVVVGISALLGETFYQIRPGFALDIDVAAWGWLHVVGGIVLMVVSVALIGGSAIARIVAIACTAISAIWNFYSIPYHPVWSIIMLVLCFGVLWALIAHGREFAEVMSESEGP